MAVVGARLMFQAGSRTITGSLGGRFLHCTMRPPQGGALPPAGDYEILPPVSDPVYGRLAVMAPVGGSFNPPAAGCRSYPAVTQKLFFKPDAAKFWEKPLATAVSGKVFQKPLATAVSDRRIAFKPDQTPGAAGAQVFVLSDRPVLGRNSIVVGSGFADLMDALQTAGGARVTMV